MPARKPAQSLVGRRIKLVCCVDVLSVLVPEHSTGVVQSVDDDLVMIEWDNDEFRALSWARGDRWQVVG